MQLTFSVRACTSTAAKYGYHQIGVLLTYDILHRNPALAFALGRAAPPRLAANLCKRADLGRRTDVDGHGEEKGEPQGPHSPVADELCTTTQEERGGPHLDPIDGLVCDRDRDHRPGRARVRAINSAEHGWYKYYCANTW